MAAPTVTRAGTEPIETPVLIVGGGPVGLMTSILLDRQGVDNIVVERRGEVQSAPAAHVVNARTFEICRAAGLEMDRIEDACQPAHEGAWVRWVMSLEGQQLGALPFESQHRLTELLDVTPTPLRNLSQHRFEPILNDHVTQQHLRGIEWVAGSQDETGVTSTLRLVASGETMWVRSRFVIGADGAGSRVRRSCGIEMLGPDQIQAFIMIHARADLRSLVADRPATLYWIMDWDHRGVFVAHDLASCWVFMHEWDPEAEPFESFTHERCAEIFRRAAGITDSDAIELSIENISSWRMTCQIADSYRDRRIFLVGDAAHRFPPSGGLGLNTGIADAHNLAWKLAALEHRWASAEILETYELERRPIAEINAQKSLENSLTLLDVWTALGTTGDPDETREHAAAVLASPEGRDAVRAAIAGQGEHFDMLGLQLGFRYPPGTGLVHDDGSVTPQPDNAVRDYLPSTSPGARLPHAWVIRGGTTVSTLDLVELGTFTLLTSSDSWAGAAERLAKEETPLAVIQMGRDVDDADGGWAKVSGVGADGALLIRPDQHVAWRTTQFSDEPEEVLRRVLSSLRGLIVHEAAQMPGDKRSR